MFLTLHVPAFGDAYNPKRVDNVCDSRRSVQNGAQVPTPVQVNGRATDLEAARRIRRVVAGTLPNDAGAGGAGPGYAREAGGSQAAGNHGIPPGSNAMPDFQVKSASLAGFCTPIAAWPPLPRGRQPAM